VADTQGVVDTSGIQSSIFVERRDESGDLVEAFDSNEKEDK
jgi:hypothetical protein